VLDVEINILFNEKSISDEKEVDNEWFRKMPDENKWKAKRVSFFMKINNELGDDFR
jgi:hypothetical protein